MAGTEAWPVRMAALGPVSVGTALWRLEGQLMVTAVVKAALALVPGGSMRLADPAPVRRRDEHAPGRIGGSIAGAAELAPQLQRVDVLLTGHAYADGTPRTIVRLAIRGGQGVVLDKLLAVHAGEGTRPFERVPIDHEQAYGGIGYPDNPLGVGFGPNADARPRVVYAHGPADRTAGFGPIPASFPCRKKLLGRTRKEALTGRIADIPLDFDWRYFQAAPEDQRLHRLFGDEWIVLESLHPTHRRLQTRLPRMTAVVKLYGAERAGVPDLVPMSADMLHIEPDADRCTVVWRGSFPVASAELLGELVVAAGLESADEPMLWPESELEVTLSDALPGPAGEAVDGASTQVLGPAYDDTVALDRQADHPLAGTRTLDPDRVEGDEIAPFALRGPRTAPKAIPGAPWSNEDAAPVPLPDENMKGTFVVPGTSDRDSARRKK